MSNICDEFFEDRGLRSSVYVLLAGLRRFGYPFLYSSASANNPGLQWKRGLYANPFLWPGRSSN